jgi:hypothetical protein
VKTQCFQLGLHRVDRRFERSIFADDKIFFVHGVIPFVILPLQVAKLVRNGNNICWATDFLARGQTRSLNLNACFMP